MLERLSVLIVEDSSFARYMLSEILRACKVGKIVAAKDGGEAINMLREVATARKMGGTLGFDLIVSDYLMSPINGGMLLRWLRQHEESPDRFMPFVMVSGAAGSDTVREARDLGVSEFLAKPFSVRSVIGHILAVVDSPRFFVYNNDYFGPCRRRQKRPWADTDRRVIKAADIEMVYSGQKLKSLNRKAKVFHFMLQNRLREKISGLGQTAPLSIDPEIMLAAEQQLDRMEGDYSDWVRSSVQQLGAAFRQAQAEEVPRKRNPMVLQINRIAHDLRGQGSTFGYPLITVFGKSLYETTLGGDEPSDQMVSLIGSHIDGINAVIRDKVKGTGGEVGGELIRSLEIAKQRLKVT